MLNTMGCYCWCVFWCLLLKKIKKLKGKFHCFTNNAICVSDTENSRLLWHNMKTDLSISYSQSSLELYIVQLCTLFDCDSLCGKSLQEARNSLKVKRNTLFKQMNIGHNYSCSTACLSLYFSSKCEKHHQLLKASHKQTCQWPSGPFLFKSFLSLSLSSLSTMMCLEVPAWIVCGLQWYVGWCQSHFSSTVDPRASEQPFLYSTLSFLE